MFLFPSYNVMTKIYSRCDKCRGESTVLLTNVVELLGLTHHFSTHAPQKNCFIHLWAVSIFT